MAHRLCEDACTQQEVSAQKMDDDASRKAGFPGQQAETNPTQRLGQYANRKLEEVIRKAARPGQKAERCEPNTEAEAERPGQQGEAEAGRPGQQGEYV